MFINPINPIITAQPQSIAAAAGSTAKFTVAAEGISLKYQWQYMAPGSTKWASTSLIGNKTTTITVPASVGRNSRLYRCKITAGSTTVYSEPALFTVVPIIITSQPQDVSALEDEFVSFTITAVGKKLAYQWQCKFSTKAWLNIPYTGSDTDTLTIPAYYWRNGYQYRCKVTDGMGNVIYSEPATMNVVVLPFGPTEAWPTYRASGLEEEEKEYFPNWEVCENAEDLFKELEDDLPF